MNPSAKTDNNRPADWDACPTGTLGGLGQRLQRTHTRKKQKQFASGALAATAAAVVLAVALWPVGTTAPGLGQTAGMTCAQCLELMPAYHDQLVSAETNAAADLSAADADAVAAHLATCPKCRGYFEQQYPGALAAATASFGFLVFATRRFARG